MHPRTVWQALPSPRYPLSSWKAEEARSEAEQRATALEAPVAELELLNRQRNSDIAAALGVTDFGLSG
ncbi:hypothetical protein ACWD4K_33920 [Streptomyces gelaticus]